MYIPKKNGDDIKSSKYYNRPYSTGDMPNCTTYSLYRICSLLQRQCTNWASSEYSKVTDQCFNRFGYGDARDWYKDWIWDKGQTPKLGAVACWSGTYKSNGQPCAGHVAIVEEIYQDGSFLTSNSNYGGTWFYNSVISSDKSLPSNKYNFKFEGFCYIPLKLVERDDNKHQVEVIVSGLRVRTDHSTNADIICIATQGEIFNVEDVYEADYRWLKIEGCWIATKAEWIKEYIPEIHKENNELIEAKKTIATLKDMNNALDIANKKLEDKLQRLKEILNE